MHANRRDAETSLNPDRSLTDRLEETLIASIIGLMAIVTFANVVARYIFNSNILWAQELTVFLFAWLVLLGACYAFKKTAHLGVDLLINSLSPAMRKVIGLIAAAICLSFAFLMLKGAWDYWANFANLPGTDGRWFPLGFEDEFRPKGWYEVNDVPRPEILRFLDVIFNEGEAYEKIPRFIPYAILPISMAILLCRFAQAAWLIWTGKSDRLVASHDAEEEILHARMKQDRAD